MVVKGFRNQAVRMVRGALIVLEGCDRSGKTTQAGLLVNALKKEGRAVELMRFPDRTTTIGKVIDDYLRCNHDLENHVIHLLFSANRWELAPKIIETLNNGTTIILDRYAYSGVAFSAAKEGMNFHWCRGSDVGLPKPDAVMFLDSSIDQLEDRGNFGEERYEKREFQKKVYANYKHLMDDTWQTVDASRCIVDVHVDLKERVVNVISSIKPHSAVKNLWQEMFLPATNGNS